VLLQVFRWVSPSSEEPHPGIKGLVQTIILSRNRQKSGMHKTEEKEGKHCSRQKSNQGFEHLVLFISPWNSGFQPS
jgi:hypothetical protein